MKLYTTSNLGNKYTTFTSVKPTNLTAGISVKKPGRTFQILY
jgi:hypothetical protein